LSRINPDDALIVPIPLHRSRFRERGHNQAEVLARLLSRRAGVPWNNSLRRIRNTHTQTTLHRDERFANVFGAFEWIGQPAHKTVILVDDVVTTGATFEAAAAVITAPSVWGIAVAHRERG
jgi:ComF family protein